LILIHVVLADGGDYVFYFFAKISVFLEGLYKLLERKLFFFITHLYSINNIKRKKNISWKNYVIMNRSELRWYYGDQDHSCLLGWDYYLSYNFAISLLVSSKLNFVSFIFYCSRLLPCLRCLYMISRLSLNIVIVTM
jgi:hypothetical protein